MTVPMTINLALRYMASHINCVPIDERFDDVYGIRFIGCQFIITYKDGRSEPFDMNSDHYFIDQWRISK